jgi:hypothetical protein
MQRNPSKQKWPRVLLGVVAAVAFTLGSTAPAEAGTVGPCTFQALTPQKVSETGVRGRAALNCPPAPPPAFFYAIQLQFLLYGDDPVGDDRLGQHNVFVNLPPTRFPRTNRNERCNEDVVGDDELYARVRARIQTGGEWSAWSAFDRSRTVTYRCR